MKLGTDILLVSFSWSEVKVQAHMSTDVNNTTANVYISLMRQRGSRVNHSLVRTDEQLQHGYKMILI